MSVKETVEWLSIPNNQICNSIPLIKIRLVDRTHLIMRRKQWSG